MSTDPPHEHRPPTDTTSRAASRRPVPESARVEAFSDGVFAIALTLLVLDLAVPVTRDQFGRDLGRQWESYVAYAAAFLTIASVWLNHHDLFTRVRGVNTKLMVINLTLLLTSSIIPFPTAVLSAAMHSGGHGDQVIAVVLYAGIGLSMALSWMWLYGYLARTPMLLELADDISYMRSGMRRTLISVIGFPAAALAALVNPTLSLVTYAALPIFFIAVLFAGHED